MENREIEVRYLTNLDELVTFFELSPGEINELVAKSPLPDGQTLENCKMCPGEAADWFTEAMEKGADHE